MLRTVPALTDPPRLRFFLPLEPKRLMRARQRIRDYLHDHGVDSSAIDDIVLAIQEAMTNAVRHSKACEDLEVSVRRDGPHLVAEVRDHGVGFDVDAFDSHCCPAVDEPGGRGLYLMAHLSDELELVCRDGLEVRIVKRDAFPPAPAASLEQSEPHDRHRASRELELLEEIDEGVFALDWEYRFTLVNSAFCRLFSVSARDLLGRTLWDVFPRAASTEPGRAHRDAMELGLPAQLEFISPSLGRWLELRVYPTASGLMAYSRDIHERKTKELERDDLLAALQSSERRFQATFEQAAIGMAHVALDGALLMVNDQLCAITGYSRQELLQLRFQDITYPEDVSLDVAQAGQLLAGEIDTYAMDKRYLRKDGSVVWASLTASVVKDDSGHPDFFIGAVQNIDERKRAEEALQQTSAEMAELLESITDGFFSLDRQWRFTYVNALGEVIFQRPRAEMLGNNIWEVFPEAVGTRFQHEYERAMEEAQTIRFEEYYTPYDGWYEINIYPSSSGLSVYMRDVTKRKRMEEALRESEAKYRSIFDSIDEGFFVIDVLFDEADRAVDLLYVEANQAATTMLGADYTGKRLTELSPDYERYWFDIFGGVARSGESARGERYASPDDRWYDFYVFKIGGPESRRIGNTFRDITKRKQAEEALRVSQERFLLLHETMLQGVVFQDADGTITSMNPAAERILGKRSDEFVGSTSTGEEHDTLREDGTPFPGLEHPAMVALRTGEPAPDTLMKVYNPRESRYRLINVQAVPLLGPGEDKPHGVYTIFDDVSERKRAEEALRESEERFRTLFENMQEGVALHEVVYEGDQAVDYRIIHVNRAYERQSGIDWEQAEGRLASDVYGTPQPPYLSEFAAVAQTGRPSMIETYFAPLDRQFRISIVSPQKGHFATIFEDITQRKRNEEELAALLETQQSALSTLQRSLRHQVVAHPHVEVGLTEVAASAAELVGGDLWDLVELNDGLLLAVVGDAAGKGVAAATQAHAVRTAVRAFAQMAPTPGFILTQTNELLGSENGQGSDFVTALVVVLDPLNGEFRMASAGHPAPLRLAAGSTHLVEPAYGPPLGGFEADYVTSRHNLSEGDYLVLYTDGVTEARRSGELFGEQRLIAACDGLHARPAQEVADHLRQSAEDFGGALRDDLAVLVLRLRRQV